MRTTHRRASLAPGFTLIELLVVIGVIILLLGILLPVLQSSATKAREVQCMGNLKQLGAAIVTYSGNYKGFLPSPAHSDGAADLNDRWDGDANFPTTDDAPYTWKGKILNYIGTRSDEDSHDEKYQVFKCPAVRLFKGRKSFYGANAYLAMHVQPEAFEKDGYHKMSHFDDMDQTAKTFILGENNTGHWAVKPETPRDASDFTASTDDAKLYGRHLERSTWVYGDGHAGSMKTHDNEENNCFLWVADKKQHRKDYPLN